MEWNYVFIHVPIDVDLLVTVVDTETGEKSVGIAQRHISGQWIPYGLKYDIVAWMPCPEPAN